MDLRVEIEPKHIREGDPGHTRYCAIALAIKEKRLPEAIRFCGVVDTFTSFETYQDGKYRSTLIFDHSPGIKRFIRQFDHRQDKPEPAVIRLRINQEPGDEKYRHGTAKLEAEEPSCAGPTA